MIEKKAAGQKEAKKMLKRLTSKEKIAGLTLLLSGCNTQKSLTRKRIKSTERGLLQAVFIKGQKPGKLSLEERMQFYKVPGLSLVVIDKKGIEWSKAYGVADIQTHELVTPDLPFQGGAFSQAIAAAVALYLVEKGTLDLDADVAAYLRTWMFPPPAPGSNNKITLRQILTHSAGLSDRIFEGYSGQEPFPSLQQVLGGEKPAKNAPVWADFKPGSRARASESGYIVLEQILTDVENKPFAAVAKEIVFAPLGMTNSTFEVLRPSGGPARTASGHLRDGRLIEGGWRLYPGAAAKGLWTTPSDFAVFFLELLKAATDTSSKVLAPATARAMLSPQKENFAFGFSVEGAVDNINFNVRGKTDGFVCYAIFYPVRGQGAVIMTNSDNGMLLVEEILRAISAAYEWPHFKPQEKPLYRLAPSVIRQYAGRYEVNPDYVLNVALEDYYLVVQPTGQALTKFYVEGETLFFSIDPFIRIQFLRDKQGSVTGLVLWQQDFELTAKKIQ
jgi:CubicO group peptidase (beta-lactamase class C family)